MTSSEVWGFTKIAHSYLLHVGNLDWKQINPDMFGTMIQAVADDEGCVRKEFWQLLDMETHTGMIITESFTIYPAASVSGWYFSHPEARYFGIGRVGRDQVEDYAKRKGMSLAEAEKWLSPVLGYDAG